MSKVTETGSIEPEHARGPFFDSIHRIFEDVDGKLVSRTYSLLKSQDVSRGVMFFTRYEELLVGNTDSGYLIDVNKGHSLGYIRIEAAFPEITTLSDEYQICWPTNPGNSYCDYASFDNGGEIQSLTGEMLNFYGQCLTTPSDETAYCESIGHVPELTSWSHHLPAYRITPVLPFFFSEHSTKCYKLKDLRHQPKFMFHPQIDLEKILRMRKRTDDGWENVPFNINLVTVKDNPDYLLGGRGSMKDPLVYAEYLRKTKDELAEDDCADEYIVRMRTFEPMEVTGPNSAVYTPNGLMSAIVWAGQNTSYEHYHSFNNYSDTIDLSPASGNACLRYTLNPRPGIKSDLGKKFCNFASRQGHETFFRRPWQPGYNIISFTKASAYLPESGLWPSGGTYSKQNLVVDFIRGSGKEMFKIVAYAFVTRVIKFKKAVDGKYDVSIVTYDESR